MIGCAAAVEQSDAQRLDFEAYYRERAGDARRYAATILAGRASNDLDDALQTAWSRAWAAWPTADPARRDAWFFRIVRNCSIDAHRRSRPTEPIDEATLPSVDTIEPVIRRLDAHRTLAILDRLSPPLREALWLREALELTYADIAAVQGVPVGTVMSRLHAARRKLVKLLGTAR